MDYPPNGIEVLVITNDNKQQLAVWNGDYWEIGVPNNPLNAPLNKTVTAWQWRTD
jgi:hypothetical protein